MLIAILGVVVGLFAVCLLYMGVMRETIDLKPAALVIILATGIEISDPQPFLFPILRFVASLPWVTP